MLVLSRKAAQEIRFPDLGINDMVTIRDLLANTSGIADPATSAPAPCERRPRKVRWLVRRRLHVVASVTNPHVSDVRRRLRT